jgi:hypothetical protein
MSGQYAAVSIVAAGASQLAPWPLITLAGGAVGALIGVFGVRGSSVATPVLSLLGVSSIGGARLAAVATIPGGAERVVVDVAQVPVGVVEQHDVIDPEHGGRGAKLTVATHPEVGRGAQRARFAVGEADDTDRCAGVDQGAEHRTEIEAVVIGVGDDCDRTPG